MPIDKSKITDEMLAKAAMCQTADELIALASAISSSAVSQFAALASISLVIFDLSIGIKFLLFNIKILKARPV